MDETSKEYLVSLNVICKDPHTLSKAAEILARTASGLALEGLTISMNMAELETSTEEVGDQQ